MIVHAPEEITVIDISCPSDEDVRARRGEKETKYAGLITDMRKQYRKKVRLETLAIGGTGAVPGTTVVAAENISDARMNLQWLQQIVAVETLRVVKRVL